MKNEHLQKQIDFIVETDKLKDIFRANHTIKNFRAESTAEHTSHTALMA